MKTTSRVELYERLWGEPRRDVARSFGVTSDRLSRLCRRNQIPIPPQGFWNRGPEERGARKVPLPNPEQDRAIAVEASAGHVPQDSPVEKPGIHVPERSTRQHPLIMQTRPRLHSAQKDEYGRYRPGVGCVHILVGFRCRQRAYRIMDAVLKECEARGWTVRIEDRGLLGSVVNVDGAEVSVGLEEVIRRKPHRLTEEERARANNAGRPYGMQLYARAASGDLALILGGYSRRGRRAWREGGRFRLEYLLPSFFKGLQEAGEWQKRTDEAYARAAAERREAERLERLLEEERRREAVRFEALLSDAHDWSKSRTVREYVEARVSAAQAKGQDTGAGSEFGRWAAWATAQADRLDPLVRTGPPPGAKPRQQSFWEIMSSLGQSRERRA